MGLEQMKCPDCGSTWVVRIGMVATKTGRKQRYKCNHCGRTFYEQPASDSSLSIGRSHRQ